MDSRVLELILIIIIEDYAILIDEAHDGRDPTGTSQKVDDNVEKPVLHKSTVAQKSVLGNVRRLFLYTYVFSLCTH